MTITAAPADLTTEDREWLRTLRLAVGTHTTAHREWSLLEACSRIAREEFTDRPTSVDSTLACFGRLINDGLPTLHRQLLKPLIPAMIGTRGDHKAHARVVAVRRWMWGTNAPAWLNDDNAEEQLRRLVAGTDPLICPNVPELLAVVNPARAEADLAYRAALRRFHAAADMSKADPTDTGKTETACLYAVVAARWLAARLVLTRTSTRHVLSLQAVMPTSIRNAITANLLAWQLGTHLEGRLRQSIHITFMSYADDIHDSLVELMGTLVTA